MHKPPPTPPTGIATSCAACRRADEAYGIGNNALGGVGNQALGVGNNAPGAAQGAHAKADANTADVAKLKHEVAYLQWKVLPRHKTRHHRLHKTPAAEQKANNS